MANFPPGVNAVCRTVTKEDVVPRYFRAHMPTDQYFTLQIYQSEGEYINAVHCDSLETNAHLQSLDVVVHDPDGARRYLCYVRFMENTTYKAFARRNPDPSH